MHGGFRLTPEILLSAYAEGLFPMAERRGDPNLYWISPEARGVIPLDGFHVSRRLARTVRNGRFDVRIDTAFDTVIRACAAPAPGREESWINDEILRLYSALFARGAAHSVECWLDGKLAGGLYGVTLGAAFFGESMFSRARDASKVALVHLVARLIHGGFRLLDAQFLTAHLARFGAVEIPRRSYLARLKHALQHEADFYCPAPSGSSTGSSMAPALGDTALTASVEATGGASWPGWLVLQLITETS